MKIMELNGVTVEKKKETVNGVEVWYPEVPDIPEVLRSFIMSRTDYIRSDEDPIVADAWMDGSTTCATFYIPKNTEKPIVVRLDLVSSLEDLEFEYFSNHLNLNEKTIDSLMKEFKKLFDDIQKNVESFGYQLKYSHSSNSGYLPHGWWDVIFHLKDWDEQNFLLIWKKFSKFNKRLKEIQDMYE
jgi:hypothetical protein